MQILHSFLHNRILFFIRVKTDSAPCAYFCAWLLQLRTNIPTVAVVARRKKTINSYISEFQ